MIHKNSDEGKIKMISSDGSFRISVAVLVSWVSLIALTSLPSVSHAQLRARSLAKTTNIPQIDDDRSAAVNGATPLLQAHALANEFGAVAQSATNVFSGPGSGSLAANAHACAGTGELLLPTPSYAESTTQSSVSTLLRVVSPTLATGTLVDIEFQFRGIAVGNYITDTAGFDYVTLTADTRVLIQGVGQNVVVRGSYGYQSVRGSGDPAGPRKTGLFASDDTIRGVITGVAVGGLLNFSAELALHTDAQGGQFTYNSADIKAGVKWSAQISNPDASLVYGASSDPFPSPSNTTTPDWETVIPPFQVPIDSGVAAPEPRSIALLIVALLPLIGTLRKGTK
jgi:hypothetical protein